MIEERFRHALEREREGRYLDSLRECLHLLSERPDHPGALALASRLCLLAGDAGNAVAYACAAARIDGADPQVRAALQAAMSRRESPQESAELVERAVALQPDVERHVAIPGSLEPFAGLDDVRLLLERAVALDPANARAHAALGNVHLRSSAYLAALGDYQRAAAIEDEPEFDLAAGEIAFTAKDTALADRAFARAFSRQRLYEPEPRSGVACRALALMTPGPWPLNAPLDFVLDPGRVALTRLYLDGSPFDADVLRSHDVILNAIGEAEQAQTAIAQAREIESACIRPFLNPPGHSARTARPALANALETVPDCAVPATQRMTRSRLQAENHFPVLVRPVDTHGGTGLAKIASRDELDSYLERHPEERFDATEFVEYRSVDGFYRKYRVVLVDFVPYAYHLAISNDWMIHYVTSQTAATPWMQAEEERFLENPRSVFASWDAIFHAIACAVGLEYFSVDCAVLADGRVLIFEADIASLVHCREPEGSYKYRFVPRIFRAVEDLLIRSASAGV